MTGGATDSSQERQTAGYPRGRDGGRRARLLHTITTLAGLGLVSMLPAAAATATPEVAVRAQRSVVDLQSFRRAQTIDISNGDGRRGRATLVDLAPAVHAWLLLELAWTDSPRTETYHLENGDAARFRFALDPAHATGLVVQRDGVPEAPCELWLASAPDGLRAAASISGPYASLCGERLLLRQETKGRRTGKEWVADLLRDHVPGGAKLTELVRDKLFRDAWLETSRLSQDAEAEGSVPGAPPPPRLGARYTDEVLDASELGLDVPRGPRGKLGVGHWLPVRDDPGVFASAVTPGAISREVLAGAAHPVNALDSVEAGAVDYLVAFDLAQFEVGFALGTDHPRVGWSDHIAPGTRDPALPGPDGIGSITPLVRTGMLSPPLEPRVAATFTGGFKRQHGAFRWGPLAQVNEGSHYGFVEDGVVLSRLQPGLATAVVWRSGRVDLVTWRNDLALEDVRFARQNGVLLVEPDPAKGPPDPGAFVTQWGPGNWSGSEDKKLRTLRAGLCLEEEGDRRYLVYGYFSTATPSAMATVFMGYGCRYAMLLDMNALEHTYLALYRRREEKSQTQHLVRGMGALDQEVAGQYLPRFVAFPDNRDFFYLLRRASP